MMNSLIEVTDKDISIIIEHSVRAANASNRQSYSIIIVDDREVIKKITGKSGASKCLVFCIDYNRIINTANHMGHKYIADNGWGDFIAAVFDTSILVQTAVIAAKSLGIDSLITNGMYRQNLKEVIQVLNLPSKYCFPLMAVLLGYSVKPENEVTGRLSTEHIVHYGTYKQFQSEQYDRIINEYDQIYPEYINDNFKHYLDYFYKEWCSKIPEEKKEEFRDAIRNAGFSL